MKRITDIDEGTIRRIDWQTLVPPTILFRAFSRTFKPTFLFLGSVLAALCATSTGFRPYSGTLELCGDVWLPYDSEFASLLTYCFPYFTPFQITRDGEGPLLFWQGALIGLVVAAWFALAFSRSTVVRLTSSARSSTLASSLFALKKFPPFGGAVSYYRACFSVCGNGDCDGKQRLFRRDVARDFVRDAAVPFFDHVRVLFGDFNVRRLCRRRTARRVVPGSLRVRVRRGSGRTLGHVLAHDAGFASDRLRVLFVRRLRERYLYRAEAQRRRNALRFVRFGSSGA